jgi:uncharacterized membrane protein
VASAVVGVIVGVAVAPFAQWTISLLSGWCALALLYSGSVWMKILPADATRTMQLATTEDDSRAATDLILVSASLASLVGVAFVLVQAGRTDGTTKAMIIAVASLAVVLAWGTVHTVFTLRYAHRWWSARGGVDFKERQDPSYVDFAYLAFTIGMTFQVSDTDLQTKTVRRVALRHALISFPLGTVIIATSVNLVAGLAR